MRGNWVVGGFVWRENTRFGGLGAELAFNFIEGEAHFAFAAPGGAEFVRVEDTAVAGQVMFFQFPTLRGIQDIPPDLFIGYAAFDGGVVLRDHNLAHWGFICEEAF